MTQPDPNYVAADRPVNRRTAGRQLRLQPQPVNSAVQARLAAAQARNRLGPALAGQIRLGVAEAPRAPMRKRAIVGGMLAAAGAIALFLALLQASPLLAAAGAAALLGGLTLAWRSTRSRAVESAPAPMPLFDEASLLALDGALDQMAPEVPEPIAAQLTSLKKLIVRIARHANTAVVDENFTMDDRLYLTECVRRYLPDTLQSYLAVPREQRDAAMLEGQSAAQLLSGQLDLLRAELEKRETGMGRSAAELLLRQQRFLQSKRTL